ncbi:amidohydrolase family protein [Pinibacter soli]|uniref:Amidohydrolase family protein n=1 Tax=Pinibacter soli TaxID=3044211 RepID=A0ABT6RDE6_9BACT|nr:amidohydrolase family protein [Pinibacter soli]MDI3320560.1 amidohydrolase family protein [Pinibacter soli]
MLLRNVHIANQSEASDIQLCGDKIVSVFEADNDAAEETAISFNNAVAIPGLINSHDHLDFNLFPQFGDIKYDNYQEWAVHIHSVYKKEIGEVLQIPQALRAKWGLYKNLLCGVTTVVDHGVEHSFEQPVIEVFQHCQSLHSVAFEKNWRMKLNNISNIQKPVVIHVGEGIDASAYDEIKTLLNSNYIKRKIIAVHGIAMTSTNATKFKALVWCPASNYFMFGQTADVGHIKRFTPVLFGSDSTLTSSWDIWQHINAARKDGSLTDKELFESLTTTPAEIWKMKDAGKIEKNRQADIVIADKKNNEGWDAVLSILPEAILLVMKKGEIQLFDERLLHQLCEQNIFFSDFKPISINGVIKYVRGNIHQLINNIRSYHSEAIIPVEIVQTKSPFHVHTH